ncbi:MAG: bifunctional methylenetetrahydrofolate dehydrogenase/methenyltetrahydrofolate cyclohydrolase FolD [Pseudomonadales bacterium]|jgi:methylenetetrahydrofolate dehydrogenase (NADP+)/methenyltetrahydrofolate cyclohydrolase|tara:strand:- start:575 stop:1447 length:873 start_codon:yes stop_codon:yes gene_type:complete
MTAQILDGNALAKSIRSDLKADIEQWREQGFRIPGLAVILIGNDPASEVYVNGKRRDCEEVGLHSEAQRLPVTITQAELEDRIAVLNEDPKIDGILVQTPLPAHLDEDRIIDAILPHKDVDGFHAYNIGRLALRRPTLRSCTPKGIMRMLTHINAPFKDLTATIIGASNHVGRPMGLELLLAGSTVTTAHKFSKNTPEIVRQSDLVISAVGKPGLVPADWIKPGAIVIDVGITRGANNKLYGDIQFDTAKEVASWITPVPGGVGPMTRVALLQNTMQAAAKNLGIDWVNE